MAKETVVNVKPRSRRAKRILEKREPKLVSIVSQSLAPKTANTDSPGMLVYFGLTRCS